MHIIQKIHFKDHKEVRGELEYLLANTYIAKDGLSEEEASLKAQKDVWKLSDEEVDLTLEFCYGIYPVYEEEEDEDEY